MHIFFCLTLQNKVYINGLIYWTKKVRDQHYTVKSETIVSKVNLSILKNISFPWFLYLNAEHVTLSSMKKMLEVRLPVPSKLK